MSLLWRVWERCIFHILQVRGGGADGATLFSIKGDRVMGLNLVSVVLPKMGMTRCLARSLRYGPIEAGGVGL